MRIFWRSLAVISGVLALVLVGVAIAIRSVDVNEFIGPIQQRIKEATGRDLTIRGGIDLKLGLEPKLVIDDVSLGNTSWAKQPQMVTAKKIEAQIALLPLLRKRFEIVRFKLIEPSIALETDRGGKGNWEFPSLAAATNASAPARSGGTLAGFAIGDIAISDGALTYRDGKTGDVTSVVIEDLSVHARDAQSPISGRFRGRINDTPVALEGDFGPLEQLLRQRWPYPVTVQGEVNDKKLSVGTQMSVQGNAIGLDPLQVAYATTRLTGQMTVTTGGPRPRVAFKLSAPTLTLAELASTAKANLAAAKAAAGSRYLFSDQPIDVMALQAFDATGEVAIDKLILPDGQHIDQVRAQLSVQNGRLDAPVLQASAFGGAVQARVQLDASRGPDAALTLHVEAKGLDLAALLAAQGVKREVRGGKTEFKADLTAHGASPRQWASTATGSVIATVGPATLGTAKVNPDSSLDRLTGAVNPFRETDPTTQLHCAVIRLALNNGVATVDRSIAAETSKLGATASGTLDFRDEMLDLAFRPQIRQGVKIEIPQVAQLVRLRGPFASPSVGIDATATAATVARLGAAVYTGGLSMIGESLLAQSTADSGAPCQIALGHTASAGGPSAKPAATQPSATSADEIGKALGKLLGR